MTCWASRYIGRPHEPTLADNCLGFARAVQADVFGRELPGMLSFMRSAARGLGLEERFPELDRPVEGCLVVMLDARDRAAHVGVWCDEARRVVHSDESFGSVVATELRTVQMQWRTVRFFEVPA